MVHCWIFAFTSEKEENIHIAVDRLIWGFHDGRGAKKGTKLSANWRRFVGMYNNISEGDVVLFQMRETGGIHALGIVRDKLYDDQTHIWDDGNKDKKDEDENKNAKKEFAKYPWRVRFHIITYFGEKLGVKLYAHMKDYLDGYGIGLVECHEVKPLLDALRDKYGISINVNTA